MERSIEPPRISTPNSGRSSKRLVSLAYQQRDLKIPYCPFKYRLFIYFLFYYFATHNELLWRGSLREAELMSHVSSRRLEPYISNVGNISSRSA